VSFVHYQDLKKEQEVTATVFYPITSAGAVYLNCRNLKLFLGGGWGGGGGEWRGIVIDEFGAYNKL
jgi:hypothetical protein